MRLRLCALCVLFLAVACGGDDAPRCGDEPGSACVWAGDGRPGFNGDGHDRTATRLYWPVDVSFAPDGTPWIVDWNNHKVREVLDDGSVRTAVSLFHPTDVVFGPDGLIYIADWHNYRITTLDPATGVLRVLGGDTPGYAGDGGPVDEALFNLPSALAFGPDGALYVLDQLNQRVRRVAPGPARTVTTVAGNGQAGYGGDGGHAGAALLHFETGDAANPSGAIVFGPDGGLYIADALNYRIRRVDLETGAIETVAGNGSAELSGDGGRASDAGIGLVSDLEFGPDGRLHLVDAENNCVRAIDLASGRIDMVWDGAGEAAGVTLNRPSGIAFSPDGRLYVADTLNHRIVRLVPPG